MQLRHQSKPSVVWLCSRGLLLSDPLESSLTRWSPRLEGPEREITFVKLRGQRQTPMAEPAAPSYNRTSGEPQEEDGIVVLACPCHEFAAMPKILKALESEDQTKKMLDWLNGTTDVMALNDPKVQRLSCGKRSRCRFRYGTSFAVLNAIRDACRPYLDQQQQQQTSSGANPVESNSGSSELKFAIPKSETPGYEDAFPALGIGPGKIKPKSDISHPGATNFLVPRKKSTATAPPLSEGKTAGPTTSLMSHPAASNILVPRKKGSSNTAAPTLSLQPAPANNKKHKRRIRPQPAGNTSSSWGKVATEGGGEGGPHANMWGHVPLSATTTTNGSTTQMHPVRKNNDGIVRGNISFLPAITPIQPNLDSFRRDMGGDTTHVTPNDGVGIAFDENGLAASLIETASSTPRISPINGVVIPSDESGKEKNPELIPGTNRIVELTKATTTTSTDCIQPASDECLKRMVEVFAALINNHLVPSTALELHLLLRLLTVSGEKTTIVLRGEPPKCEEAPLFFQPLFCSSERCQVFATMVLINLSFVLKDLGLPLLIPLVQCTPFRMALPALTTELDLVLQSHIARGLRTEYPPNAITGTHAILSLPFQHNRDSRHNYKSQAEVAMYKNREESRDAFLYQLRAFVDVRKGNLLLRPQAEVDYALERIRAESRKVIDGLLRVNMAWFAQFFCDLLLQMGLAPIEEIDQELLTIAGNKEKLQKLHKRFSSKGTHANKSTKKLVIAQRNDSASKSPVSEAQLCFPGHQEFFFAFFQAVDNYSFGVHLRNRTISVMLDLSSDHSATTCDIEKRLMNLQMFARFLGYLVFSPNWDDGADMDPNSSNIIKPPLAAGALEQLDSLGLSVDKALYDAWHEGYLVEVVPWVTELLKMAKWDYFSQSSRKYRLLLGQLRCIQEQLSSPRQTTSTRMFEPTRQVLCFYLETLFHETVGFSKLTSLPKVVLGDSWISENETSEEETRLDQAALGFSSVILFASSPHVEDLYSLIMRLSSSASNGGKSPGKTKKLRPSIVRSGVSSTDMANVFQESPTDSRATMSIIMDWRSPSKNHSTRYALSLEASNKTMSIQAKLVDAFFHQHRDLKDICEFTVNRVLRNASNQLALEFIRPAFKECGITGESFTEESLQEAQQKVLNASSLFLRSQLENSARKSVELLGPARLSPKLVDVAASLAVARGMQAGKPIVDALITTECVMLRDTRVQAQKKQGSVKNYQGGQKGSGAADQSDFQAVINAIANVLERVPTQNDADSMLRSLQHLESSVNNWKASEADSNKIPPESNLHAFFQLLLRLDQGAPCFINWCLAQDDPGVCWSFLAPYLRAVVVLAQLTKHGMKCLMNLISTRDEFLRRLIECGSKDESLESLLMAMVGSSLVSPHQLRSFLEVTPLMHAARMYSG